MIDKPAPQNPWIDATHLVQPGIPNWPGDPPFQMEAICSIENGDECNVSRLSFGSHTGTHIDAPRHFIADGAGVDQCPVQVMIGHAIIIEIIDPLSIKLNAIQDHIIAPQSHVLFKTRTPFSALEPRFEPDYVYIETDAAEWLHERQVVAVGIDGMSVDKFNALGEPVHFCFLNAGIWIIENLNLSSFEPGNYKIVCAPLKIADSDGAPARVLLQRQ